VWAHSVNGDGRRHGLVEHLRATGALARRFAEPFGAGELAEALGLLHDAGKADCLWQERLFAVEGSPGRPVGRDHKRLGARMLAHRAGAAAMAVLGHHGGLGTFEELRSLLRDPVGEDAAVAERALQAALPEASDLVAGPSLLPATWREPLVFEMGLRLTFSALVDADHLDTAAHFTSLDDPQVAPAADMARLLKRFEAVRAAMLAARAPSPVDGLRVQLYRAAVDAAAGQPGLYRLPAPTGSGKTMTAAAFGLHHAAVHGKSRVIVAVPFLTITEQNAQVYRTLLGSDAVLEHHSAVELDRRRGKLGAENWDAPFVVTTTVQLFDSLFGRKPARSRKLHRLANAVIVLDEVQALPVPLLVPILDALRLLAEHFGTTVLLASATQPAFEHLDVWRKQDIRPIVANPELLYAQLRRVRYEWWLEPKPVVKEVADRVASERQALVVVNTTADAREIFGLVRGRLNGPLLHLSTRMCPVHRQAVLADVRARLEADEPVVLVSTQLIEAGVDLDFPVVYRALAPADSLQQAAGRANREGRRPDPGRVVIFDAQDAGAPATYRVPVAETRLCFGLDRADPDNLAALAGYYRRVYDALNTDHGERAMKIQERRAALDFIAVADGPLRDAGNSTDRDLSLAFRMLDDETVPVVVTAFDRDVVEGLLDELRRADGGLRETFRALQPYTAALPRNVLKRPDVRALCDPILGGSELLVWRGPYDADYGIDETDLMGGMIT
jgi:CRISPR-associated endonuclease/helicase Cas3